MCMWALALWAVLISRLLMRSLLSDVVDYGMNVQEALETARWTKQSANGCDFSIEDRVPLLSLQKLSEWGHEMRIRRGFTLEMGRGQAILHNAKSGINYAGSDPRTDGAAAPEPISVPASHASTHLDRQSDGIADWNFTRDLASDEVHVRDIKLKVPDRQIWNPGL